MKGRRHDHGAGHTTSVDELVAKKLAKDINSLHSETLSLGDKVADKLSRVAGSWTFIGAFFLVLLTWVAINTLLLVTRPFDPYPFILLNLLLSCLAAIQAPVIMMSQNRQEAKDRLRAEQDYEINLKTEILVEEMIQRLTEIEKQQAEILESWRSR